MLTTAGSGFGREWGVGGCFTWCLAHGVGSTPFVCARICAGTAAEGWAGVARSRPARVGVQQWPRALDQPWNRAKRHRISQRSIRMVVVTLCPGGRLWSSVRVLAGPLDQEMFKSGSWPGHFTFERMRSDARRIPLPVAAERPRRTWTIANERHLPQTSDTHKRAARSGRTARSQTTLPL